MQLEVLYEDNHAIVVRKPAGVLVQGDASGDTPLLDEVKKYLKAHYNKPGNVFVGLVHRLDRPVEGVILFAKTSKGAARFSEQFREHTTEKIYHAVVVGEPKKKSDTLVHFLRKREDEVTAVIFDESGPDTQHAELAYEIVEAGKKYSLLRIILKTGRAHQIRAQFSHIGHPIVGDTKYGGPHSQFISRNAIALAATQLTFAAATMAERVTVSSPIPKKWFELIAS